MSNFDPNEYFKQLAIEHVDIQHTKEKPAYFREYSSVKILFNNSDFLDKMRYVKRTGLVSQFNNDGQTTGGADNKFRTYTGAIYVITKVLTKSPGQTKDEAQAHINSIMEDILARMQYDLEHGNIPITFELNNINYSSLDEIGDGFYAQAAFMRYSESVECIAYNPDKWAKTE